MTTPKFLVEVITLPVSDVEGAMHYRLGPGTEVSRRGSTAPAETYARFANFSDPDGNSWVLQERGYHEVGRRARADARWLCGSFGRDRIIAHNNC